MKLKQLVAAAVLLAVSAGAQAAFVSTEKAASGNSDLVLSVFDSGHSYFARVSTLRLDSIAAGTYTMSGLTGVAFSATANTTFWGVVAADSVSETGGIFGTRILTTSTGAPNLTSLFGDAVGIGAGNLDSIDTTACSGINPCVANTNADATYVGGSAWGADFGGLGLQSGNYVSASTAMDMYLVTPNLTLAEGDALNVQPVSTKSRWKAVLNLAAGTLTIQDTQVAAVPVPAAFWLLGSGLGAMGVFGRRRRQIKA